MEESENQGGKIMMMICSSRNLGGLKKDSIGESWSECGKCVPKEKLYSVPQSIFEEEGNATKISFKNCFKSIHVRKSERIIHICNVVNTLSTSRRTFLNIWKFQTKFFQVYGLRPNGACSKIADWIRTHTVEIVKNSGRFFFLWPLGFLAETSGIWQYLHCMASSCCGGESKTWQYVLAYRLAFNKKFVGTRTANLKIFLLRAFLAMAKNSSLVNDWTAYIMHTLNLGDGWLENFNKMVQPSPSWCPSAILILISLNF